MEKWSHRGLYSLSGKTSYRKISWSLEAARFGFKLFQSLWNLAGTSAALLPRCLSNFRAIRPLQHPISRLRDFTRFGGKTSYRLVNRGPSVNDGYDLLIHALTSTAVNTLRPRQNGRHFSDDIFKRIFLNENAWILFKISLKFVPKGPINNIPALVQIMAWRRPGDKPLSESMLVSLLTHKCVTRPQWVN